MLLITIRSLFGTIYNIIHVLTALLNLNPCQKYKIFGFANLVFFVILKISRE